MSKLGFFSRWLILATIVGVIAGLGAAGFFYALELCTSFLLGYLGGYYPLTAAGEPHLFFFSATSAVTWKIILIITLGGLISGIIVYNFAPEAEGHGTDAYISAFHNNQGRVRPRVPLIKAVASAIIIGSGGSAGREGPIAQIGAGLGSWLVTKLKLSDRDRRIALICGCAGGIGAIFKAPLGGAIFALEVLYKKDIESEALLPAFLSSTVAYSIFGLFFGFQPIFATPAFVFNLNTLIFYVFLGILCAPLAYAYIFIFNFLRKQVFITKKIPNYMKPAIGAFFVGLLSLFLPQVLGPGYGWIQLAIYCQLGLFLLLLIIIAKIVATSLTIGSGGSGGVFAPSLFIGAMIGAAYGLALSIIFSLTDLDKGAFVIVGMAAFVTAAANVLIAPIIMVSEMTETYTLLVPCMISCTIAYILASKWTIYESQVPNKANSPVHKGEFTIDILDAINVEDAMSKEIISIHPEDSLKVFSNDVDLTGHMTYPVLENNNLVGMIAYKDVLKVPTENLLNTYIKDIMSKNVVSITPKENLSEALLKMNSHGYGHLPVVDPENPAKLIGFISKGDIIKGHILKRSQIFSTKNEEKTY